MNDLRLCLPNNGDSLMADGACHYEPFLSPNCLVSYNCSSHHSPVNKTIRNNETQLFSKLCQKEPPPIRNLDIRMYIELGNFRVLFTDGN